MSMKLAFSDFDGTLCIDGGVPEENLQAIKAWQAAGNKFGIATGRGYRAILPEIERHHIPVDFMVCTNGSSVYDAQGKLLQAQTIPQATVTALLQSQHVTDYTGGLLFFTTTQACMYNGAQMLPPELFRALGSVAEATELPDMLQVGMEFPDQEQTLAAFAALDADFPKTFAGNINRRFLDINIYGTAKDQGILALARRLQVPEQDIWAIGDDRNDLPMLRRFGSHGCCVARAKEYMHEAAGCVYDSVGAMLYDNL